MRAQESTSGTSSAARVNAVGLQVAAGWPRVRGQRLTRVVTAHGLDAAQPAVQQSSQDKSLHRQHLQPTPRAHTSPESAAILDKGYGTWCSTPGMQHQASSLLAGMLKLAGGVQDVQDFLAALILSECAYKKVEMGHTQVARKVSLYAAQFEGLVQLDSIQITLDDVPQHYIVCTGADALYVAFMGTKQARDLITDAAALHQPVWAESLALAADNQSTPAAHSGFLQRARAVDVEQLYALAQAQGKRLVLCGHSLGGAVAKLATLRLLRELPEWPAPRLRCISFATPAVGNAALARLVESAGWDQYFSSFCLPEDPLMRALMRFHQVRGAAVLDASSVSSSSREASPSPGTAGAELEADNPAAGADAVAASSAGGSVSTTPPSMRQAWSLPAMGSWAKAALDAAMDKWHSASFMQRAASSPPPPASSAEAEALSDKEAAAVEEILSASPRPNLSAQDGTHSAALQQSSDTVSMSAQQTSPNSGPQSSTSLASSPAASISHAPGALAQQTPTKNLALTWALQRSRVTRQLQRFMPPLTCVLPSPSFHMFGSHLYLGANAVWPVAAPPPPGAVLAGHAAAQSIAQAPSDAAAQAVVGMADAVDSTTVRPEATGGLLATAASMVQAWSPAVPFPRSPFAMHSMKAHRRRVLSLLQLCKRAVQMLHEQGMLGLLHHGDLAAGASLSSIDQESLSSIDMLATLNQQPPDTTPQPVVGVRHLPQGRPEVAVRTDLVPHMAAVRAAARVPLRGLQRVATRQAAAAGATQAPSAAAGARQMELLVMVDGRRLQYSRSVTASWLPAGSTSTKPLPVRVLYTRVHAQDAEAMQGRSPASGVAGRPAADAARRGWHAVQASVRNALQFLGRSLPFLHLSGPHDSPEDMCSVAVAVTVPEDAMTQLCVAALQPPSPSAATSHASPSGQSTSVPSAQAQLHLVFKSDFQHEAIQVTMLPWRAALLSTSRKTSQLLQTAMAVTANAPRTMARSPASLLRVLRSRRWVPWPRLNPPASVAEKQSGGAPSADLAHELQADGMPQPWSRSLQAAALVAATVAATAADVPGSQAISQAADLLLPQDLPSTAALLGVAMAAGLTGLPATKAALLTANSEPISTAVALSNTLMHSNRQADKQGKVPVLPEAPALAASNPTSDPAVPVVRQFQFTDWIDPWVTSSTTSAPRQAPLVAASAPKDAIVQSAAVTSSAEPTYGSQGLAGASGRPARRPFGRWIDRMAARAPFQAALPRLSDATPQQPLLLSDGILLEECTRASWLPANLPTTHRSAQAGLRRAAGWLPVSLQQVGRAVGAWLPSVPITHLPAMLGGRHVQVKPPAAGSMTQQLTAPAALLVAASLQDEELQMLPRSRRIIAGIRAAKAAGAKVLPVLLASASTSQHQQREACKAMAAACDVDPQEVYVIAVGSQAGADAAPISASVGSAPSSLAAESAARAFDGVKQLKAALLSVLQQQHGDLISGPEGAAPGALDGQAIGLRKELGVPHSIRSKL